MQGARWWLVCYDVREPGRLRRTARHMEGYGERVQYSVFRCWLTARQMEQLRWELTEILESEDDILMIPICGPCATGIRGTHTNGESNRWPGAPPTHLIV
jgi:CRISPR-associated protein Cas2